MAANQVAITTFPRVELNPHHLQMENAFVKMENVFVKNEIGCIYDRVPTPQLAKFICPKLKMVFVITLLSLKWNWSPYKCSPPTVQLSHEMYTVTGDRQISVMIDDESF